MLLAYRKHLHLGKLIPAMGYYPEQAGPCCCPSTTCTHPQAVPLLRLHFADRPRRLQQEWQQERQQERQLNLN